MFELNDTQKMIQQVVRSFVEKEIAPNLKALEAGEKLPYEILKKFAQTMGLTGQVKNFFGKKPSDSPPDPAKAEKKKRTQGSLLPGGMDPMIPAILFKEISRVSPGFCMAFVASLGCGTAIAMQGNDEQRARWAFPVYAMEKVGCWALTEPLSGSDAFGSMKTTARLDGDQYVLKGSKTFISNAPYADVFVIFCKLATGGEKSPVRAFVLERGDAGLSTGAPMEKMGMWDSPTGEIFLDDVRVPQDRLLGPPPGESSSSEGGKGEAKATLQWERAVMPAMCLGIIERCVEESVKYAAQREAFGRKIAEYQLIQEKLARMYVSLENARNLNFKLAWMQREGKLDDKAASSAKLYCAQEAVRVSLDAIQVMGGTGYMREAPVEKLMRDAKMFEIGGGTSEIQTLTIARELLREAGVEGAGRGASS
ncbi:MAG: acyl-CoA dehydrogenase family protein [Bdellovibrionota bacterium]